ncbi:type II secretion system protein GspI [Burkholderia sp. WAC0059]|uniref:type II secretion system minor pseudopilin GspI n=1 Tax=Burkholderia sp. WAC0059 TaxID=2066022 RepID=UPI000C7EEEF8|nr:type II secretion system minor pseudopilin GspI [Burkholderia sp. WAC0059]PLZ01752.1 type II secretion system protein GspI [Burkholderia sp. WAC0059]
MTGMKWQGSRGQSRGFTLIEVLIALAIVAIAMGAVLMALGALSTNVEMARSRLLAAWSADNVLASIVAAGQWPLLGRSTFPCPQGHYLFVCRETVTQLDSALLREVEVRVYGGGATADILADAVTVIENESFQ